MTAKVRARRLPEDHLQRTAVFIIPISPAPHTLKIISSILGKRIRPVCNTFNVTSIGRVRAIVGYAVLPNLLVYNIWRLEFRGSTNTSLGWGCHSDAKHDLSHIRV